VTKTAAAADDDDGIDMHAGLEAGAQAFRPLKEHQRPVLRLLTDGLPTDGCTGESLGESPGAASPTAQRRGWAMDLTTIRTC
jgi:hypothetical protein